MQVISDKNFSIGFNRIYDISLALGLRRLLKKYKDAFEGASHLDLQGGLSCWSIRAFDDAITRRTFKWKSVDEYYAGKFFSELSRLDTSHGSASSVSQRCHQKTGLTTIGLKPRHLCQEISVSCDIPAQDSTIIKAMLLPNGRKKLICALVRPTKLSCSGSDCK